MKLAINTLSFISEDCSCKIHAPEKVEKVEKVEKMEKNSINGVSPKDEKLNEMDLTDPATLGTAATLGSIIGWQANKHKLGFN